ncbi:MAG: DUF1592 domain-containing protein [Opitutaceae bacterium]|nr:DUF1592 domain-containing protein [Opitutaceae bacterium]
MFRRALLLLACLAPLAAGAAVSTVGERALERTFDAAVRPLVERHCLPCHGRDKPEAELDLSGFTTLAGVVAGLPHWELVLDRLEAGDMPPSKAKQFPTEAERRDIAEWIKAVRREQAQRHAGDPGVVLARRLNHAEYDYTIRDLTGVDIRPTREFPVDPANQAGFDNSGESLAMSPALLKKYLGAARVVSEHLILRPEGFAFAPHPVVADTDRDKYAVLRLVEFYRRQPTDLADYFQAAWRHGHRKELGRPRATLAEAAAEAKLSAQYLGEVWALLNDPREAVGPIARLQARWRELPAPAKKREPATVRAACELLRDQVLALRAKLVPEVKNLSAAKTGIHDGAQALVLWKNRTMAANRRRHDPAALHIAGATEAMPEPVAAVPTPVRPAAPKAKAAVPSTNSDVIQRGGKFIAPAITTAGSSATVRMVAAKNRAHDPDLAVPAEAVERARHEAAFARFAAVFPDAFYITERARVYLDAEKEQKLEGRLLSAGLHSQTGFFRDDGPLYEMVLDEAGRRELDALWREFSFAASVPQRMHTSLVWFERTDSSYLRDDDFNAFRAEDKAVVSQDKIRQLGALYLAKAIRMGASEAVQTAIERHFATVAADCLRVEQDRLAAEPTHLKALEEFAARAYRRPLTDGENAGLRAFYRTAREDNGGDHEEAMRDCVASVLMSPHFCHRVDLGRPAEMAAAPKKRFWFFGSTAALAEPAAPAGTEPLSAYSLASRLSYFLWSSMPDPELLARAAAGDLHRPEVIVAQVRRMLADGRARNFATEFAGHWLDFRRFDEHNGVDRERFPAFDNELRAAMAEEPVRFFLDVARSGRPVLDFLYGDYTWVNASLARHYGLGAVALGDDGWARVARADEAGRGGLLPMAVFLTANSPGLRTSPVKRGYWVARRVLGERIPPPPAEVPNLPNDEKHLGELTLRETLARHREDKACSACHARFDSFGLVFEGYGAVGERRTVDFGGRPVDTRAEFPGGTAGEGLAGLRDYIRAHREDDFLDNLCRKLAAYALGRSLLPSDDALIAAMRAKLTTGGHRFGPLVEAIVTSPQFLRKRAVSPVAALAHTVSQP